MRRQDQVVLRILVSQLSDDVDSTAHHCRLGVAQQRLHPVKSEAKALGVVHEHLEEAQDGFFSNVALRVGQQEGQIWQQLFKKNRGLGGFGGIYRALSETYLPGEVRGHNVGKAIYRNPNLVDRRGGELLLEQVCGQENYVRLLVESLS